MQHAVADGSLRRGQETHAPEFFEVGSDHAGAVSRRRRKGDRNGPEPEVRPPGGRPDVGPGGFLEIEPQVGAGSNRDRVNTGEAGPVFKHQRACVAPHKGDILREGSGGNGGGAWRSDKQRRGGAQCAAPHRKKPPDHLQHRSVFQLKAPCINKKPNVIEHP